MLVANLVLEDFRNYAHQQVELTDGLNLVVGRNAQGKTNLLEAVYRLSGLSSPRGADTVLVREGAETSRLRADVTRRGRSIHVDMELRPGRAAKALVNRSPVSSTKVLGDLAVSVFFGPDELSLVKGSPDGRRRFLDDLIVKLRPAQASIRKEWERVLKQRNALLRRYARERDEALLETLEVWDESFFRAGAALGGARLRALAALVPFASDRYSEIAGGGSLTLSYVSSWCTEDLASEALSEPASIDEERLANALRQRVEQVRRGELERGVSLAGPGRDDVNVALATPGGTGRSVDARTYASQGDQRTCALALKLGEHDLLKDALDDPPILLLDDVFSELDPHRRGWLRDAVRGAGQTLLSSAEIDRWEPLGAEAVFEVSGGTVQQIGGSDG
ncbi:MAG: DNA replication/repair protein RecF [Actinomycetota bacterium]